MKQLIASAPSFTLGYWKPWEEKSDIFNSYLDYLRDTSLTRYGADTIGQYISQASNEQIDAINQVGRAVGLGMNILSSQLQEVNESINFINRNLELLVEQQRLTNLLLQNISELLRVPDSEKERQHCIELGVKFFVNASRDTDLYADALEELLEAERLMKQDYFVLHRIGCIYLHVEKYLDPHKALDYFLRAAKYASVESDEGALRLIEILSINSVNDFSKSQKRTNLIAQKSDAIKSNFEKIKATQIVDELQPDNQIGVLAAESFEKAAFASYLLGDFHNAVLYQEKALNFDPSAKNSFNLSKYLVRTGKKDAAVSNLRISIEQEPVMLLAVFKELDLINCTDIQLLLAKKNDEIDSSINELNEKWKAINALESAKVIDELKTLASASYEVKVSGCNRFDLLRVEYERRIIELHKEIELFIADELPDMKFEHFKADDIASFESRLNDSKNEPLEKTLEVFEYVLQEIKADRIRIGSKFGGGIVFYLDQTKNHGLVCADKDFGNAIWGKNFGASLLGTHIWFYNDLGNGIADGTGMKNTKIITTEASNRKKGIFKKRLVPIYTAARLCMESNYNGFNDWYLPTVKELKLIFENLHKQKIGGFDIGPYWSSCLGDRYIWQPLSAEFGTWVYVREEEAYNQFLVLGIRKF